MEKLQQALKKAREQRGERSSRDVRAPGGIQKSAPAPDQGGSAKPAPVQNATGEARRAAGSALQEIWSEIAPHSPNLKHLLKNRITTYDPGAQATHFDILRTKILLQMRRNNWTRLAITSPSPGCGKTTTACNLAMGLSRQPDLHAMLLEMDLRRPSMGEMLGVLPERDITAMLMGNVPFAEQAVRIRDNVAVSMARKSSSDPTKVMLDPQTQETMTGLEALYKPDLVIYDLPPILVSDDTRAFLANVDCALLVVQAGRNTVAQIDQCEREIAEHTNMVGVVLNQCHHVDQSMGYGDYEAY